MVEGHDLLFRRLSVAEGLSQTKVSAIVQDNLGFMWFATQYGLDRYDGYKFKIFRRDIRNSNSLGGVNIRALFKDRNGMIWIGCDRFLDRLDPTTESFTHYRIRTVNQSGAGATVLNITQDRRGVLWLSTSEGLYSLNPETGEIELHSHDPSDPFSLSSDDIRSTKEDSRGAIWVATSVSLDAYNPATGKVSVRIPGVGQGSALDFFEDSSGTMWLFHAAGGGAFAVYDPRTNMVTHYAFEPPAGSKIDVVGVHDIFEDRENNLWVATSNVGLLLYDRKQERFISYRNDPRNNGSIGDDQVDALFQDRDGNIWIGLHQVGPNFFSLKPLAFQGFTHQPGTLNSLGGTLVSSVYQDRKGVIWISSGGSLNRINRKTGENRLVFSGDDEREIHAMIEDDVGALWGGTETYGLREIDEETGQFKMRITSEDDRVTSRSRLITRLLVNNDGTMWATTWDGLKLYDRTRKNFTLFKPDIRNRAEYYAMARDSHGVLWIGSDSGLHRFDPTTRKFSVYIHDVNDAHSLSDSQVDSVHFDRSGTMWVGTQDGLDRFDPTTGTFEVYRDRDGLPGNVASCILSDDRNNLWISTNNGISRFDPKSKTFRNYSIADGLSGSDLTGWGECYKSPDGEMFFAGFSGATSFYPDRVVDSIEVPKVVLTDFRLSNVPVEVGARSVLKKVISLTDKLALNHRQNMLSIEFATLNYMDAAANHYRYRLDGLNENWHEVGSDDRQATYTTLPSGRYTFRVQGSIRGGPWGEPGTALKITVLPAWWNSWWFRSTYVVVILLLLWGSYRLRLRQLAFEQNLRLQERLGERNRIARELHDTLLQGFQGLMLRFQGVMKTLPSDTPANHMMEQVLDRADQVILEGRQSVRDLRQEEMTGDDLADALMRCGEDLAPDYSALFSFSVIGTPKHIEPLACKEVYRIGREAIANAFQHSMAAKIEAEIAYADFGVSMTIRDNGRGIDQVVLDSGRSGHWGLSGMRERAENIGAELSIWSRSGAGTEVNLMVPPHIAFPNIRKEPFWHSIIRGAE